MANDISMQDKIKMTEILRFADVIEKEIEDEERAHITYNMLADSAYKLGLPSTSHMLRSIAADELRHSRIVAQKVSVIRRLYQNK